MQIARTHLPSRIQIGNKAIGGGAPAFFVAEVGNNHNGDYFLAKRTMEQAVQAGASAVKFQKRFIDETFARELQERPQTKDQIFGKTYGEYRRALELPFDDFVKLKARAAELDTIFFATPFDRKSADFLEEVGVPLYKIASFDATNLPLLDYVAQKGKPIILSSGMTSLDELDEAVRVVLQYNPNLVLLHCVSVYPTTDERLNLLSIPFLRERYAPLPVGYSGHERDFAPTLAAIALGAACVERHITLSKELPGPDHATVSIDVPEFAEMVKSARRIETALGRHGKFLFDEEMATRQKHSKSIVARAAITEGTEITAEMLTVKSPGHGLKSRLLPRVVGGRARRDIGADAVITAEDVELREA